MLAAIEVVPFIDSLVVRSVPSVISVWDPHWMISKRIPSRIRMRLEEIQVEEALTHSKVMTHSRKVGQKVRVQINVLFSDIKGKITVVHCRNK